jgi:hypothetical protein
MEKDVISDKNYTKTKKKKSKVFINNIVTK